MAMDPTEMADKLKSALGFGDQPNSKEMIGLAKGIITELKTVGLVNFLPGTITGNAPSSGGPLINGKGSGGIISGISGATMGVLIAAESGMPPTPQVLGMANAIATHILTGIAELPVVTGICSNTASNPGVLIGEASGGEITGLSGAALFSLLSAAVGGASSEMSKFCNELTDYIMKNAEITFLTGTITGTASAGGGPIIGGTGIGGTIS